MNRTYESEIEAVEGANDGFGKKCRRENMHITREKNSQRLQHSMPLDKLFHRYRLSKHFCIPLSLFTSKHTRKHTLIGKIGLDIYERIYERLNIYGHLCNGESQVVHNGMPH